jgi:hypothetical protein
MSKRGIQKPCIEEEQIVQWQKVKRQRYQGTNYDLQNIEIKLKIE